MGKTNKFTNTWKSATDLGKQFGLSAIAVNKILAEHNLRDPFSKSPTEVALNQEYAIATPLKDGTMHYMWNIKKVIDIISKNNKQISPSEIALEEFTKTILRLEKESEETGFDKFLYWFFEAEKHTIIHATENEARAVCSRLKINNRLPEVLNWISGKDDS
jgi:hypothetical protein